MRETPGLPRPGLEWGSRAAGRCLRGGREESEGGRAQIPCGRAEPVRPRADPDPARGRAEAARCAPPRAPPPPPLRANFAVSLKETSWGLRAVGEGRSGALGAIARPGRSRMCPRDEQLASAGWRASGSLGACPSLSSPGPSAPRRSGGGMERKRPAGRWWCRGACPLGKFRAGPGFGWVGGGGWAGADKARRDPNGNYRPDCCCERAAAPAAPALAPEPLLEIKAAAAALGSRRPRGENFRLARSSETSHARSTFFSPVTLVPVKDLSDLAPRLLSCDL